MVVNPYAIEGYDVPPIQVKKDIAAERRRRAASLYAQGLSLAEIGEQLRCGQHTVASDLAAMRKGWRERMAVDFAERKGEELAKIDELERSMWQAWNESRGESVATRETEERTPRRRPRHEEEAEDFDGFPEDDAPPLVLSRTINERSRAKGPGNVKYAEMIARCIDMRCKLLGLMDSETNKSGNTVNVSIDWTMIAQGGPALAKPDPIEMALLEVRNGGTVPPSPPLENVVVMDGRPLDG